MCCAPLPTAESSVHWHRGLLLLLLPGTSSYSSSGFAKCLLAVLEARWQCCLEREALALCTPGLESLFHQGLEVQEIENCDSN